MARSLSFRSCLCFLQRSSILMAMPVSIMVLLPWEWLTMAARSVPKRLRKSRSVEMVGSFLSVLLMTMLPLLSTKRLLP